MIQRVNSILKGFVLIQVIFFLLNGCAFFGFGEKEPEKSPEELMSEGLSALRDFEYEQAADSFQKLKDRYPYSKFAVQAELKMADALFDRGEFEDALEAYREFEKLHPKNESIPYIIYRQGMCSFRRMNTIDRDQTPAKDALQEFERLREEFPGNPFSLRSQRNIRVCLSNLAEYEFYVGHFYFKAGHYLAAQRRFEYLIQQYPDLGQYGKALAYLAKCKEKLSEQELSQ